MVVLPAKTLFKYRAMDYKSLAILLWSLVYWSNSLASKGWTLLALCPFHPLWIMLFRVSPNLITRCQDLLDVTARAILRLQRQLPLTTAQSQRDYGPEHWHIVYAHFLVYPNQRNKSKGSCQMKNPIRVTMSSVGVSTSPHPPDLNDTALVKRITKERGWLLTACCSWLAPGQPLSSCLLFTTDMGISIFCPTKIKRRWFLITGDTIVMNLI